MATITQEVQRVNNTAQAGRFTVAASILAGLTVAGILLAILYHPLWFSLVGSGVVGFIVLFWRILEHDRRAYVTRTITEDTQPQPQPLIKPEIHGTGNVIRYGRYSFPQEKWTALARAVFDNQDRFVRDVVAGANVFTNITKNWAEIVKDFERLGLVHNNQLTNQGIAFFSRFSPYPEK